VLCGVCVEDVDENSFVAGGYSYTTSPNSILLVLVVFTELLENMPKAYAPTSLVTLASTSKVQASISHQPATNKKKYYHAVLFRY
jgi:hypothetical protein